MQHLKTAIVRANAPEILQATADAVALNLGCRVHHAHPFAADIAEFPLRAGAMAAGILAKGYVYNEDQRVTISRGLRDPEFAKSIAAGLQAEARRRFDLQAQHRRFAADVEVDKIGTPSTLGEINFKAGLANVSLGGEYFYGRVSLGNGESITLHSFGRIIEVLRETIFNDDTQLMGAAVHDTGLVAARYEAKLVAEALTSTGNMADGKPIFHATDFKNVITTVFGETGFGECLAALRNQPNREGLPLDFAAMTLVVAANLEGAAAKIVADSKLQINVTAMASLPAGRYFLIADRELAKTIATARLTGANHPLSIEPAKPNIAFDGLCLKVRVELGSQVIGRYGIIRGGA